MDRKEKIYRKDERLQGRLDNLNKKKKNKVLQGKSTDTIQNRINRVTAKQFNNLSSLSLGGTIGDAPMKKDKMIKGGSLRRNYKI